MDAAGGQVTWNMVHYDVQLIGGWYCTRERFLKWLPVRVKHWCQPLPAYLNALYAGEGVHIVTVNDHLACRDQEMERPHLPRMAGAAG